MATNLEDLEIARLKDAAKALRCGQRKLLRVLAANGIPVIELGERGRGVLVMHLDQLVARAARPALHTRELTNA